MTTSLREATLIRLSCYLLKVTPPSRETVAGDMCNCILTILDASPQQPPKNKWIFHGAGEFPIQPIPRMSQSRIFGFSEKSKKQSEQCNHRPARQETRFRRQFSNRNRKVLLSIGRIDLIGL
jgi:hypothetical protein